MIRPWAPTAAAAAGLLMAGGCGGSPPPGAGSGTAPPAAARIPLPLGFYVATDTPCGAASNATLSLFHGKGLNGAREACEFTRLEAAGPATWRTTERCTTIGGMDDDFSLDVTWTVTSADSFRRDAADGWTQTARFCPQSELPAPWRDNDLSVIIDAAG